MPEEITREEESGKEDSREWTEICILKAQNAVRFILEDLELLLADNSISGMTRKSKLIRSIKEDLEFVSYFLEGLQQSPRYNLAVSNLVFEISDALEVLLAATDSYISCNIVKINFSSMKSTGIFLRHYSKVSSFVRKIKIVQGKNIAEVSGDRGGGESFPENSSRRNYSSILEEDIMMVGFDGEAIELLDKLTGGTKQLQVISIIGMGGIGKTTFARRLYRDPLISYYFHVRAWTYASEFYQLSNLLSNLLCCIVHENDPIFCSSCDAKRGEKLYKSLKGRRYLIVIDDVWSIFAWRDLEIFFPKDNNGSRILLTSRSKDVAMQISPDKPPHLLRFLNQYESWDLFKQQVLPTEDTVPDELEQLGKTIVAHCKGLPRAIVAIAGILSKEEKTEKHWREFERNIRSCTGIKLMGLMIECLELSYKHLLLPLQSCFLYLGTFPENYEIPVKRLIWSWIGEGFVEHIPGKRLEDVAEDYLKALIDKSLVIVVKKSSDGGIKSCQIHTFVRDLCLVKAKEKGFLLPICDCHAWKDSFCSDTDPVVTAVDPFSTCRKHFHPYYNAFYAPADEVFTNKAISIYRLLRRLELGNIFLNFPVEILQLLHLRYLALKFDCISHPFPSSIFDLRYLETCIFDVDKRGRMELPTNIWKMVQLRHLFISQEMILNDPPIDCGSSTILENLQTISHLYPSGTISDALARTPNVRSLGFYMTLSHNRKPFFFPYLAHLHLLEKLKFEYQTLSMVPCSIGHQHKFPPHLKKLTLIGSHVSWEEMSIVALLPNLEILKIEDNFFSGPIWETNDDGFCRLRYLKLSHMDLHKWISSSDHFPRLEHLVLNGCLELEEIPVEIGDIHTLQTIEVYCSSETAMESANLILKYQKMLGNDDLEVFLYHHLKEFF